MLKLSKIWPDPSYSKNHISLLLDEIIIYVCHFINSNDFSISFIQTLVILKGLFSFVPDPASSSWTGIKNNLFRINKNLIFACLFWTGGEGLFRINLLRHIDYGHFFGVLVNSTVIFYRVSLLTKSLSRLN